MTVVGISLHDGMMLGVLKFSIALAVLELSSLVEGLALPPALPPLASDVAPPLELLAPAPPHEPAARSPPGCTKQPAKGTQEGHISCDREKMSANKALEKAIELDREPDE